MARTRLAPLASTALALLSASCLLGPAPVSAKNVLEGASCTPSGALSTPHDQLAPEEATTPAPAATARGYSPRAIATAHAIGAGAALERLAQAELGGASHAEIVDLRGQLNDQTLVATLELASVIARLRCEEGRADQIASDLRDAEEAQTRRITAYSLVVSASAAITTGILTIKGQNDLPASIVGISGGVVGGALGFATLAVHRETTFPHEPNLLGQVWRGGDHPDFSGAVWAYLTRPQFSKTGTGDRTIRDGIVETWRQSGRLGDDPAHPDPRRIALYFGDGGIYDASGLGDRSDMLSEVREALGLMSYALQHLTHEAAR